MKKIFFVVACISLFSCNDDSITADKITEAPALEAHVTLPFKLSYDGAPTPGKTENIATVMKFNGDFIAGKLDSLGFYFADSVHAVFEDGVEINTVRDSMVAIVRAWRGSMLSAQQSYISAVAINNKDKGHEWVFQWINESHNYKNGEKEHRVYHEDYRLENGKIRELFQYAQAVPEKK